MKKKNRKKKSVEDRCTHNEEITVVDGRCVLQSGTQLLRNAAEERRRKLFGLKLVPTYLVDGTLCEMRLEHILPRLLHPVFHINARSSHRCVFYTDSLFFPLPQASSSCWRSQREIGEDVLLAYANFAPNQPDTTCIIYHFYLSSFICYGWMEISN